MIDNILRIIAKKLQSVDKRIDALSTQVSDTSNSVFGVGSVMTTSENVNPSAKYGGSWSLVKKSFSRKTNNADTAGSLVSGSNIYISELYVERYDDCLHVRATFNVNQNDALGDSDRKIFKWNLESLGISESIRACDSVGWSDDGNGIVMVSCRADGLFIGDVITKKSSDTIPPQPKSGSFSSDNVAATVRIDFVWNVTDSYKLDSACDCFTWRRVA